MYVYICRIERKDPVKTICNRVSLDRSNIDDDRSRIETVFEDFVGSFKNLKDLKDRGFKRITSKTRRFER